MTTRAKRMWTKIAKVIAKISVALLWFKQILPAFARLEVAVAALLGTCHNSICEQFAASLILAVHLHNLKLIYLLVICCVVRIWWWKIIHYMAQLQWNGSPGWLVTPTFCITTVFLLFFDLPWYCFSSLFYIIWWLCLPSRRHWVVFFTQSDFSFGMIEAVLTVVLVPFHQGSHCFALFTHQRSEVQNRHSGERLVWPRLQHRGRVRQPSRRSAHLHQNHLQQGETASTREAAGYSGVWLKHEASWSQTIKVRKKMNQLSNVIVLFCFFLLLAIQEIIMIFAMTMHELQSTSRH